MKIPIGRLSHAVFVICPNKYSIHTEIYVRYAILVDVHGYGRWLDNPSEEGCGELLEQIKIQSDGTKQSFQVRVNCPFCDAHEQQLKGE